MQKIDEKLNNVTARVRTAAEKAGRDPAQVALIAVSKTRPAEALEQAYRAGQRRFGENYLQEALDKQAALAHLPDLEWHFIGPIQSNKTRAIAEHFAWVHSVDREKIARRLSDQRPASEPPLQICLQVNLDDEPSKAGISLEQLPELARAVNEMPAVTLRGLMAIPAPQTDFNDQRASFARLREAMESLNARGLTLDTLSMGMSADLEAAVAEGATQVRVGTDIFGPREPAQP
ncbi:YggS family pyridoxal phosphate-dependent enzyme [Marinimicrobium sp. C2-29]|uniref:YggS family pyridoxal phosphate-dependent enzyme n=1 Tax=Marinimicrobium sp. C2-29 TaxID=3139825 RepID=UPI00313869B2